MFIITKINALQQQTSDGTTGDGHKECHKNTRWKTRKKQQQQDHNNTRQGKANRWLVSPSYILYVSVFTQLVVNIICFK